MILDKKSFPFSFNKLQLAVAFFIGVFSLLTLGKITGGLAIAQMCLFNDGEMVIQHSISINKQEQLCSVNDIDEIKKAKSVIKKYWKSSYLERYSLFSKEYREALNRAFNIRNAKEYEKHFADSERTWQKQTYQKAYKAKNFIQIIILSTWFEEGYEGVMTFIFDMVKEGHNWKIANIKF